MPSICAVPYYPRVCLCTIGTQAVHNLYTDAAYELENLMRMAMRPT